MNSEVIAAIIGGFLAGGAGVLVELYKALTYQRRNDLMSQALQFQLNLNCLFHRNHGLR